MKYFYEMFPAPVAISPQLVDDLSDSVVGALNMDIFSIPWGHYRYLIDKYKDNPKKALFFVRKTIENGWSRGLCLNLIRQSQLTIRNLKRQSQLAN